MAKGQKRSNRETRKPKQDKPRPVQESRTFLGLPDRPTGTGTGAKGHHS